MNQYSNFLPFSSINSTDDDTFQTKIDEDRYEVYVNGDFIGYKVLFGHNESVNDIKDFLLENGINDYEATLDGDHYNIESKGEEDLRGVLSVYLQAH